MVWNARHPDIASPFLYKALSPVFNVELQYTDIPSPDFESDIIDKINSLFSTSSTTGSIFQLYCISGVTAATSKLVSAKIVLVFLSFNTSLTVPVFSLM